MVIGCMSVHYCLGLAFTVERHLGTTNMYQKLFIQKGMISFLCKIRGNSNLQKDDQPQELQGNTLHSLEKCLPTLTAA